MRLTTPVSHFVVEKRLILRRDRAAALEVLYRLTNCGAKPFPFLFKLHPAFAVTKNRRIAQAGVRFRISGYARDSPLERKAYGSH
jgi:hypothetical protein